MAKVYFSKFECGGIFPILGQGTMFAGIFLAANMFVAYWTADHEALVSIFSDPGRYYVADPFAFLFTFLIGVIFGAGLFSLDHIFEKSVKEQA